MITIKMNANGVNINGRDVSYTKAQLANFIKSQLFHTT